MAGELTRINGISPALAADIITAVMAVKADVLPRPFTHYEQLINRARLVTRTIVESASVAP